MNGATGWRDVPAGAPLVAAASEVHLWRLDLDQPAAPTLLAVLGAQERGHAARLRSPRDRDRYVVAHGLLRQILARYTDVPANRIAYRLGSHGKPSLIAPGTVRFNLSRSAGVALCAVTGEREIGVDVERIRAERDHAGIAARYFAPGEAAAWHALPPARRLEAFYACWTRKEAYVKARGDGLSLRPDAFAVTVAADAPAALVRSAAGAGEPGRWTLHGLVPAPGYMAAVAVEGGGWTLRTFSCGAAPVQPAGAGSGT